MITEIESERRAAILGMGVNIVLISTYELGRQPFGLASPAAWLRKRGHSVVLLDLARQSVNETAIADAQLIAIYLPMHTATRLAAQLIPQLRKQNPHAHLCCYGLYAPMNVEYLRALGVTTIRGGEFEEALVQLAERLAANGAQTPAQPSDSLISMARLQFEVPDRSGMPAMEKYAHLIVPGDGYRIVGSTEASRGCKHLCRHCPIVPVYKGQFRIVSRDVVLEDIRRQVAAGAQHITFGDPDFFNGIRHAMELVEAFHREFPAATYDVTIKIEHLLKYEQRLPTLRDTGCLFVISAVESVADAVLGFLDKGHTRKDFLRVIKTFRELGMTLHPTFVPFTPWTTFDGYLDLLRVIAEQGVVENVAPIQLGIAPIYIRTYLEGRSHCSRIARFATQLASAISGKRPVPQRAMVLLRRTDSGSIGLHRCSEASRKKRRRQRRRLCLIWRTKRFLFDFVGPAYSLARPGRGGGRY